MRLITTRRLRALEADRRDLELLRDRLDRLEDESRCITYERDHLKSELNRQANRVVELTKKLNRYHRMRGAGGRFTRKEE